MAKLYKLDSAVHKAFEESFQMMEEKGIIIEGYGGNVHAYLDEKKFPNISEKNRHVLIVDADSKEQLATLPPFAEFRIMIFDS